MELNYATIVEAMADRLGDQPSLIFDNRVFSYREFDDVLGPFQYWLKSYISELVEDLKTR